MPRLVCDILIDGRVFTLVVTQDVGVQDVAWFEGRIYMQQATVMEAALGIALEKLRRKLAKLLCHELTIQDCFDCEDTTCQDYWGPDVFKPRREDDAMPDKKTMKKLEKRGVNPFAVANAMVNKGKIPASKKEAVIKGVTKSALKPKAKAKAHSKARGKKGC